MAVPLEIIGLGQTTVTLVWEEGPSDVWTARDLRLRCTCAHCQSEATGERLLDPASVPAELSVEAMNLIGNYGLNIHFSDKHGTGIYRFRELWRVRREREADEAATPTGRPS